MCEPEDPSMFIPIPRPPMLTFMLVLLALMFTFMLTTPLPLLLAPYSSVLCRLFFPGISPPSSRSSYCCEDDPDWGKAEDDGRALEGYC